MVRGGQPPVGPCPHIARLSHARIAAWASKPGRRLGVLPRPCFSGRGCRHTLGNGLVRCIAAAVAHATGIGADLGGKSMQLFKIRSYAVHEEISGRERRQC